jgi:hypothetical protein
MMSKASVKVLIGAVYEPHYERYANDFGNAFAGFFSDEPEFGNGELYAMHRKLGFPQDLPWSLELEEALGIGFQEKVPLLWDYGEARDQANARIEYMETATLLVKECFSMQIGQWCRQRGIGYIGHAIEDNNTHACTGSGLGHYFRSQAGQTMAGVDCIGTQVIPGGEDNPKKGALGLPRDGEFYHYALAKLAVSAASLDEGKAGRSMCEIFGNYGWKCGVSEMKYLADHFLVRGVNNFVPHAFSLKSYPDNDCPPHFYAHGHNPLFRHIGALFAYMNRVCSLVSGLAISAPAAVLYHAQAEWAGEAMLSQVPARRLYDAHIDFVFLSTDDLDKAKDYKALVVPRSRFLPKEVEKVPNAIYIDKLPEGFEQGEVVKLDGLVDHFLEKGWNPVNLNPHNNRIRCLRLFDPSNKAAFLCMLANEGSSLYEGRLKLPESGWHAYNAWDNRLESVEEDEKGVKVKLWPRKSLILVMGEPLGPLHKPVEAAGERRGLSCWRRSICRSADYPNFRLAKNISLPDCLEKEHPSFSGFVRYEASFVKPEGESSVVLEITQASEGVEVFLNGKSLGIQVVAPFLYDLSEGLVSGENAITVEVATTLERERLKRGIISKLLGKKPESGSGLTGTVALYVQRA